MSLLYVGRCTVRLRLATDMILAASCAHRVSAIHRRKVLDTYLFESQQEDLGGLEELQVRRHLARLHDVADESAHPLGPASSVLGGSAQAA